MNRFKELRVSAGKSQVQIAQWLSISQAAYSKYECGKAEPSLEALDILSRKYNVSIDYLLGREGKKPPENQKGTTVNDLIQKLPQQYVDFLKNLEKKKGPIDYNKSVEPIFERFKQKGITAERFLKLNETQKNALFNIICAFMESIE